MKVAVVALGKIGLPLAVQIASKGHSVIGVDIAQAVVDLVNAGTPPFPGEAHLDERLRDVLAQGRLSATTDTAAAVAASEVVVVVVPLIVDEDARPDYRALDAATAAIAEGLQPGTLVSYETTMPVHTTRRRLAAALAERSGFELGRNLFVCHSPERVFSGRIFADLRRYPKLVGGTDPESSRRAIEFYESCLDFDHRPDLDRPNGVWDVGSAEAAELTKLAETTYRDVNIALANEFARFAADVGVGIGAVIDAANSQPYSHIHRPGIAVGGHCIPVYPRFYLENDPSARLPAAARSTNDEMPAYAVELLRQRLADLNGRRVAVLGAAYRGGVKETAFSGVFGLVTALRQSGALPYVHDPLYSDEELRSLGFEVFALGDDCDGAILQADHVEYRSLSPDDLPGVQAFVDGRNVTQPSLWPDGMRVAIGA